MNMQEFQNGPWAFPVCVALLIFIGLCIGAIWYMGRDGSFMGRDIELVDEDVLDVAPTHWCAELRIFDMVCGRFPDQNVSPKSFDRVMDGLLSRGLVERCERCGKPFCRRCVPKDASRTGKETM